MAENAQKIELRHLRCFLAAAGHGSFRRAAVALGMQESSISRRIRDLEDQIGVSLFQRFNGGVRLTIAGERFQIRAQAILGQVRDGVVDISSIGRGTDGRIRIGLIAPIPDRLPADLLRQFSRSHAGVHIELVDGDPSAHVQAIQHFDLDVAFLVETRPWFGCDVLPLWSERLFALLPENHRLSCAAELSWADLTDETFIVAGTALGQELRSLLTKRLADLGHTPIVQPQNVGCDNLLPLVALRRGLLLSIRPVTESGVVHRPIVGETLSFAAIWSPNNDNPAFRCFLSMTKALRSRKSRTDHLED